MISIPTLQENADGRTHHDVLNFSYSILAGRIMEAYRFIESMNDLLTLKKMAYYCMKHELLDAAISCFSQMGRAYAVSAINTKNCGYVSHIPEIPFLLLTTDFQNELTIIWGNATAKLARHRNKSCYGCNTARLCRRCRETIY